MSSSDLGPGAKTQTQPASQSVSQSVSQPVSQSNVILLYYQIGTSALESESPCYSKIKTRACLFLCPFVILCAS
eukprot:3533162-Pyramimonas_sp.AAC.1